MERITVTKLVNQIPTEADAYLFMERLRWGKGKPVCPHCGDTERSYFLNPANGVSRKTRTGANSERRVWKCGACRKQFSVMTGTIFHGSKVPLRTWLLVVFEMCANKNGLAAREVERKYGVTPKTAWFMTNRIREAMKREPLVGMMRGVIVADETFIGGAPKNKHRQGMNPENGPKGGGSKSGPRYDKTAVLALVDTGTGEVRSRVVPDVTGPTLRKAIAEHVDMGASVLHTDGHRPYIAIGQEFEAHESVDHSAWEYVRGDVTTNHAEGYFSQLKRSVDGTHHHVSTEHLARYLAEFDFRYTTRKMDDTARMAKLFGQVDGRRLTYRPLTGEG